MTTLRARHSGRATPPGMPPKKWQPTTATGRGSTYPEPKPVQTKPATSNLDSQTVFRLLAPVIKDVKKRRQILMVTHSPNIAVVCDAEQIIHAFIDRANGNQVVYTMGSIESPPS